MSQRDVEHLIGRLVTDEEFRDRFVANPRGVLTDLVEHGLGLSVAEIDALLTTGGEIWQRAAREIDPRLQKASLKCGRRDIS